MNIVLMYVLVHSICAESASTSTPVCYTVNSQSFVSLKACEMEKAERLKRYKVKPKFYCIESSTNH